MLPTAGRPFADLIRILKEGSFQASWEAEKELVRHGEVVIAPLVAALESGDVGGSSVGAVLMHFGDAGARPLTLLWARSCGALKREVIHALKFSSPAPAMVMSCLLEATKDEDPYIRLESLRHLVMMEANHPASAQSIIAALDDQDEDVRSYAMFSLGRIPSEARSLLPLVVARAAQRGLPERNAAIGCLLSLGLPEEDAYPIYAQALADGEPGAASTVASCLREVKEKTPKALEFLVRILKDPDGGARAAAAASVGEWGKWARPAVPTLVEAASDPHPRVRMYALQALWKVTRRAKVVLPAIMKELQGSKECKEWMSGLIGEIGPAAAQVVPYLAAAVKSSDADTRWAAASALASMGDAARPAIPALVAALRDKSGTVAGAAAVALSGIASKVVVAELVIALRSPSEQLREYAADALGGMGRKAKKAIPELLRLMREDSQVGVRGWAAIALAEISGDKSALFPLLQSIASPNPYVRLRSAHALGCLGKAGGSAVPLLKAALNDTSTEVVDSVREALKKIGAE